MENLIKAISEKTGISPEQAKGAAETAINFIKDKLPAGIGSQLDSLVGGNGGAKMEESPLGKLGNMFGK